MGGLQRTLLAALGYPAAQEFDLDNLHSVRSLVVWLENMKVRCFVVRRLRGGGGGHRASFVTVALQKLPRLS